MKITANSIVDSLGTGEVTIDDASFKSVGILTAFGSVNIAGVATVGIISSTNVSCTNINSQSLVGDGSGLTNIDSTTPSKAYAFKIILGDPPLRS